MENFVYDLVHSDRSNGSDERMYANQWFDRCGFSFGLSQTFLLYLVEWGEVEETLEKMFRDYQEDNRDPADSTLESGMERVLKWDKERKELLRGNVMEKTKEK